MGVRIKSGEENPEVLFGRIERNFGGLKLPSPQWPQTMEDSPISVEEEPKIKESQVASPPPAWKKATHPHHTKEMDDTVHGTTNHEVDKTATKGIKDKLRIIEGNSKVSEEDESEGSVIRKSS